jgi:hypothetical protein
MITSLSSIQLIVYSLSVSAIVSTIIAISLCFYFRNRKSTIQFVLIPLFAALSASSFIAALWALAPFV